MVRKRLLLRTKHLDDNWYEYTNRNNTALLSLSVNQLPQMSSFFFFFSKVNDLLRGIHNGSSVGPGAVISSSIF